MILLKKPYKYPIQPEHFEIEPFKYPIQPENIASFGPTQTGLDVKTETAARWIIWFCRDRDDSWHPFTKAEIEAFLRIMKVEGEFSFGSLPDKLVRLDKDEECVLCTLTHEFVSLCFLHAPTNIL